MTAPPTYLPTITPSAIMIQNDKHKAFDIRYAEIADVPLILDFIHGTVWTIDLKPLRVLNSIKVL